MSEMLLTLGLLCSFLVEQAHYSRELLSLSIGDGPCRSIVFVGSRDGRAVVAARESIQTWDLRSARRLNTWPATAAIRALAFDEQRDLLAIAGERIKLVRPNGENAGTYIAHDHPVTAVAFSPTKGIVASAGADGIVR